MSYVVEWLPSASVLGLVAVVSVPHLGLLVLAVVLLAAAAAVVAIVGAIVAAPYLLVRLIGRCRHARTAGVDPSVQLTVSSVR